MPTPAHITVDNDKRFVEWTWSDVVTLDLMQQALASAVEHPDWDSSYDHLVVFEQQADWSQINIPAISSAAYKLKHWQDSRRIANRVRNAIVLIDSHEGAESRLWKHFAERGPYSDVRIFTTREDALNWLAGAAG